MNTTGSRRRVLGTLAVLVAMPCAAFAGAFDDFFQAVKMNDAAAVKTLLSRGIEPNIIEPKFGHTGMILALHEEAMDVFKVLLNAPDVDIEAKAFNGDTALMVACYKGNKEAVAALLAKGAEVNRPGWAPLHYAAASGNNEIVQMLLDKSAYIDAESPNKTTPLMMAARAGHIYTVKLLMDEGADATLKNDLGMNAIDFAAKHEHPDIAEGIAWRLKRAGKM